LLADKAAKQGEAEQKQNGGRIRQMEDGVKEVNYQSLSRLSSLGQKGRMT